MVADDRGILERVFNLERQDVAGLPLAALANLCTIGSYYYLQPLGDTLALTMGLEFTPLVTVGNMVLIVILNPIYAAVVRTTEVTSIVAIMYRYVSVLLLIFAFLFYANTDMPGPFAAMLQAGHVTKLLSFCFAVYVGTISLFTTTTLNARLASLHTKSQAKRVYGMIAAGAQVGQLTSSLSAPLIFDKIGNLVVIVSALLYECTVQLMACRSSVVNTELDAANAEEKQKDAEEAKAKAASGAPPAEKPSGLAACFDSAFGGFAILASTPFLRAITGHTLLITFLVSGVWYERAAHTVHARATASRARFSHCGVCARVCVVQVRARGRRLRRL